MKKKVFGILLVCLNTGIFSYQTILMKNGETFRARVLAQTPDSVTLETEDAKTLVVPKKKMLKIVYRDLAKEEADRIRKEEEARLEEEERLLAEASKEKNRATTMETNPLQMPESLPQPQKNSLSFYESIQFESPSPATLVLASSEALCQEKERMVQYFWLFGTFPLNRPALDQAFANTKDPIRIRQEATALDVAFTALGGFLVTLSRKTWVLETCPDKVAP